MKSDTVVAWGDEMRIGLYGQVRRVWAPRGVRVRQRVQIERVWRYLALAVDGRHGALVWRWLDSLKGVAVAQAVRHWREAGIQAIVWDRARSHKAAEVRQVGLTLIQQPPYSPELNPAERVFEEVRRRVEGRVYATIDEKVQAVEEVLRDLAADPERVRRLTGWDWIHQAFECLPENTAFP